MVFQWILAYRECGLFEFDDVAYWSVTGSKSVEVDFVISRGDERFAIEAKASEKIRDEHLYGLRAIEELRGLKRRILVYCGERTLRTDDNIDIWPWRKFVEWMAKGR